MKKEFVIASVLFISIFLIAACSKGQPVKTTDSATKAQEDYTPFSDPLENSDAGDVKAREITPSGDPKCFLSPCDCNCYYITNVPLTAKKVTCGLNCRAEYSITGCLYRGDKCVALK